MFNLRLTFQYFLSSEGICLQNPKSVKPSKTHINLDKHTSFKKPDYIYQIQEDYHLERQFIL